MRTDIFVLVNNEFKSDPRVRRSVEFLAHHGYRLIVASGVIRKFDRGFKDYCWGKLFHFRTLKAEQISWLRPFARYVSNTNTSRRVNNSTIINVILSPLKSLFISLLFILRLINLLLLNIRLVLKFHFIYTNLYYSNDFDTVIAASVLAWMKEKPFVYETHELFSDQLSTYPTWYRRLLTLLEGWCIIRAAYVVTVGEQIARVMYKRYQLADFPVVLMSCPSFQNIIRESNSECPYKLLYHGIYHPERGLEQLILAMHKMDNAHLYLRGFGYWEDSLRNLLHKEKLQKKVTFLKPVSMNHLVEAAASFDIGVGAFQDISLNSRLCLPNKVFEYMMAGLALALSDLPELSRIVHEYDVGVTFDPSNPTDIALKINQMLVNPDRLQQMQANALRSAKEEFNFENEGQKLLKIVEALIGSSTKEKKPCVV